jgi:hypothetical protein
LTDTAAPTPATPSPTIGATVDAEIAVLKAKIAVIEAAAKTDWAAIVTWVKSSFLHIVLTWPAAAVVLYPVVKKLLGL